ncbi:MAG: hypothetical protein P0S94_02790, partial [Simkaniaceae bacterium]|nr:hypothetical protein [Simkaniaceae bacterium]
MGKGKKIIVEEMSILEAVDHLSTLAELDEIQEDKSSVAKRWFDEKQADSNRNKVKQTFRVVHNYLKDLSAKEKDSAPPEQMKKGVESIMTLATEAAEKVDRYTNLFKEVNNGISNLTEYKDLNDYYHSKIAKKFKETLEAEEEWHEEWEEGEDDHLDIERRGLRDLETVKRDQRYELFYLNKEDGRPFFNKNLIRHIKLVNDFDRLYDDIKGDDQLLKLQVVRDKDLHASAKEIAGHLAPHINPFYRIAKMEMSKEMVATLYNALISLTFATSAASQIQNTAGKSSQSYFTDFHRFLRRALESNEYYHALSSDEANSQFVTSTIKILHALSGYLYRRIGLREEVMAFVAKVSQHKPSENRSHRSGMAFWNGILDTHEAMVEELRKFPNGPLFKTLDLFRDRDEIGGYDPISQGNLPTQLYSIEGKKLSVHVLRMACPTKQTKITEAHIIPEFSAFMRHCLEGRKQESLLYINLQDRTSWEDRARCDAIEKMQHSAEFSQNLFVVTIPKYTDFYYQADAYLNHSDANDFLAEFKAQFDDPEACGFYFPKKILKEGIIEFATTAIDFVHEHLLSKKKVLTRKNRLDAIETVYNLLILKLIEIVQPNYLTCACKDSVDVGATSASTFFAFIKLIAGDATYSTEEEEFLIYLLFGPAISIRERGVDQVRLSRTISM